MTGWEGGQQRQAGRGLQPLVFSDPSCSERVESIWGPGLGAVVVAPPAEAAPDSFLEHGVGGGQALQSMSHESTPCLQSVLRHTSIHPSIHRCGLGPAVLPGPRALPPHNASSCQELGPPWTPSPQSLRDAPMVTGALLLGTCMMVTPPLENQAFCACGDGEWPWPRPGALCRGNPTGNGPGQMAALPVLVPGTRMCCLTSGGGPGRPAALRGLVCSWLVPLNLEGTGLG